MKKVGFACGTLLLYYNQLILYEIRLSNVRNVVYYHFSCTKSYFIKN